MLLSGRPSTPAERVEAKAEAGILNEAFSSSEENIMKKLDPVRVEVVACVFY